MKKRNIKTLRFINFVIDTIIFTLFIFIFFSLFKNVISKENVYIISIGLYFLYYFLQEYFLKKTFEKWITKTEIVSNYKRKNYFLQILIRTITRFIIIDVFSYLFTSKGFHDLFSKTETVKITNH